MIISTKTMSPYKIYALSLLSDLHCLKKRIKRLEQESREIQHQLAIARAAGDLDHLKDPEKPNTYRHDDLVFTFSPGTISYDFSDCQDVKNLESDLKQAKDTSIALGLAIQKTGKPFWTVE